MKLRKAIELADRVFITASDGGNPVSFQVAKPEVVRVLDERTLEQDLDNEDFWSWDDGIMPLWEENDLYLRFA
jgi:hypothetical protein